MQSWFEKLFGTQELSYLKTQSLFRLVPDVSSPVPDAQILVAPNGRQFPVGFFSTPSLSALRAATTTASSSARLYASRRLRYEHVVIDGVLALHADAPGATFQVASQFNSLEFSSPVVVPEDGVEGYANDFTQGPACALACAAGALMRNYFAPVTGSNGEEQVGQTMDTQINGLQPLLDALPGCAGNGVVVRNGYTFSRDGDALNSLRDAIAQAENKEELMGRLQVGVQRGVGVAFRSGAGGGWKEVGSGDDIRVTQVFCSALSIAYDTNSPFPEPWQLLAQMVLDGCYEATLRQAEADRRESTGSGTVHLTFIGGGVFGNSLEWIAKAIARALIVCASFELSVKICHYRRINTEVRDIVDAIVLDATHVT